MRHFRPFLNFDKCRLEADSDVTSGLAVENVGVDVRVKFGDSRSKASLANERMNMTKAYRIR